jgi:predicted transposase YbfD/YdcC
MKYDVSSGKVDAHLLAKIVRGHWGIEHALHWVLDINFQEDTLRYRDRIGVQNWASMRKLVLGA